MMYQFILDDMQLPVAPAKITVKAGNKNKTLDLISIGEVNILKNIGLREFSFKILLPGAQYPFVSVSDGFKEPSFYLEKLRKLKEDKRIFSFEMLRAMPGGGQSLGESADVSLEEYPIEELAGEEGDFWVSITLKEYRWPQSKVIKVQGVDEQTGKTLAIEVKERPTKTPVAQYIVVSGDTLWSIAKRELNNGARYAEIAELNGIQDPNKIYQGQLLRLSG